MTKKEPPRFPIGDMLRSLSAYHGQIVASVLTLETICRITRLTGTVETDSAFDQFIRTVEAEVQAIRRHLDVDPDNVS